jgi:hypothetical protein
VAVGTLPLQPFLMRLSLFQGKAAEKGFSRINPEESRNFGTTKDLSQVSIVEAFVPKRTLDIENVKGESNG